MVKDMVWFHTNKWTPPIPHNTQDFPENTEEEFYRLWSCCCVDNWLGRDTCDNATQQWNTEMITLKWFGRVNTWEEIEQCSFTPVTQVWYYFILSRSAWTHKIDVLCRDRACIAVLWLSSLRWNSACRKNRWEWTQGEQSPLKCYQQAVIMLLLWLMSPGMAGAAFTSQVTSRTVIKDSFPAMKEIQMNYSFSMGTNLRLWNLLNFQMGELLVADILLSISIHPVDEENVLARLWKLLFTMLLHKGSRGSALLGCPLQTWQEFAQQSNPDVSQNNCKEILYRQTLGSKESTRLLQ